MASKKGNQQNMGSGKESDDAKSWADAFQKYQEEAGTKTPKGEGWFTFSQLKEMRNLTKWKMRETLREMCRSGAVETFTGSEVSAVSGYRCRQVWYRIKDR